MPQETGPAGTGQEEWDGYCLDWDDLLKSAPNQSSAVLQGALRAPPGEDITKDNGT